MSWGGCGLWSCCMGRGYWVGWGRVGGWGWEERTVVLRTMPTLATIKLSRRWGTRLLQSRRLRRRRRGWVGLGRRRGGGGGGLWGRSRVPGWGIHASGRWLAGWGWGGVDVAA